MIAATHFDPVVGIDIHIVQPPGPVPPIPVPHPFVGMVIDPMEYAPYIGGTVMVNGMMRGTAGTGGKGIPAHVPIGGVFVKPPANECEIFMGSQTVTFDGDPASRLGLPSLSCHDIGMPSPIRKKPHTKPKSLELPTSVVLAVPKGMPVLIGGPPTISLMAMAMKFGMAVLGRLLKKLRKMQKASRRWRAVSDRMRRAANALLDRVPGGQRLKNMVSNGICSLTGHPVDVASGKVTTESTDIALPGPLPFRFARVWYSNSDYVGPLGHGWHHSYDLGLYEFPEGVVVRLADGRFATFEPPTQAEPEFNRTEKLFLRRTADAYEVETLDGLVYSFSWRGKPGEERPLAEVRDPNGNRIEIVRENDKLTAFIDSGGRSLPVVTDARGRITEIHGPDPENAGQTFALATFRYSREGDLVEVGDALGHPFRYAYGNHLLLRETDRVGLSFYFMYDSDGPDARCLRTWGDGDLFLRDLRYDLARRHTEVVNAFGNKTIYEWNEIGVVTAETDPLGGVTMTVWGQFGDKLSVTDANGGTTSFEYDDFGRLVSVTDATGASVKYVHDAAGNHTTYIDPLGHAWIREYDERRNAIAITNPLGHRQAFELDSRGLPVRAIDALGRASEFTWNAAGLLAGYTDRSGGRTESAYDALGRIISRIDPLGGIHRLTYDRRGRLIEEVDPAGRRTRRRWDGAGYVTEFTDPMGRVTTLTYGAMGRTASVRTPSGRETRFRYDTEGELVGVAQPGGERWEYVRDAAGRVVEERTPDGRVLRFGYDSSGRLNESVDARGQRLRLTLDAAGRVTDRQLPDGTREVFRYDPRGLPVMGKNSAAELNWVYDPCGRPVAETLNGKTIVNGYDRDGNRVSRTSPLGHQLTLEYDPEGRLVAAADGGTELFRSTLDALGQERRRVAPSGAVWEWDYLPTGETTAVRVRGRSAFERHYAYDDAANPIGQADSVLGRSEYRHDADGYLIGARHPDGTVAEFARDTAGNILPPPGVHVRRDRDGNVVEKQTAKGDWQFTYDTLGRLARASSNGGVEVAFAYDPLGRRIRKTVNGTNRVEYLWDGDLVLGEVGTEPAEYLFRPGTFEPLARLGGDGAALIESDPIGLPRSAVGPDGQVVWHAAFEPFGGIVAEHGRPGLIPVRYPGQFADAETGLFYNRFRYHDPDQRAYLSPDPYGYTGSGGVWDYTPNPLVWSDPYGLRACRTAAHRQAKARLGIPASQQPTRSWTVHDPARVMGPGTRHPSVRHQGKISEYQIPVEGGGTRYVYIVDHNHDPFHGGIGHVHTAQPPPGVDRLNPGMRYNEIGEPITYP